MVPPRLGDGGVAAAPTVSIPVCSDGFSNETQPTSTDLLLQPGVLTAPAPVLQQNGSIWVDGETVNHLPSPQSQQSNMSMCTPSVASSSNFRKVPLRSVSSPSLRPPSIGSGAPPSHIGFAVDDEDDTSTIATHTLFSRAATPRLPRTASVCIPQQHRQQSPSPRFPARIPFPASSPRRKVAPTAFPPERMSSTSTPSTHLSMKSDQYEKQQQLEEKQKRHLRENVDSRRPLRSRPIPKSPSTASLRETREEIFYAMANYEEKGAPISAEQYLGDDSYAEKSSPLQQSDSASSAEDANQDHPPKRSFPELRGMKARRKGATLVAGVAGGVAGLLVLGPLGAVAGGVGSAAASRIVGKRLEKRAKSRILNASNDNFRLRSETSSFS